MSQNSIHLSLPFIQGGQAQKHVTHNEAVRILDAVVQLRVQGEAAAPTDDAETGDRYIVAGGATDSFTGREGQIASYESGAWVFLTPSTGWVAYDVSTGGQIAFDGTAWVALGGGATAATDRVGINTSADSVNRLASAADATLLTHDTGGGHQLKLNKATDADTASLLFQTGFSGRAEMGTTGSDDFEIKVSADGNTFHSAIQIDGETGEVVLPNTPLADLEFGASSLVNSDYVISRSGGLITNGTGYLGNNYNFPPSFSFDAAQTPNLPGAMSKSGYYAGVEEMTEFVAIDPNQFHRTSIYLRQEGVAGDWSGFANGARHTQHVGFRCYDADGLAINGPHHMRFHHAGIDSLTTLTAPLSPGDSTVQVANATGWNESDPSGFERGLIIFGYRNALGHRYDYYSRLEEIDMFELGAVNKALGVITLKQPLPAVLGNPDHPSGTWPVGTRIANRSTGWSYKLGVCNNLVLPDTDRWYRVESAMGGIDLSGQNAANNFAPGTAAVRPVFLPNYSNRIGGWSGFADTGPDQRLWVAGLSVDSDPGGTITREANGSCTLRAISADEQTGAVSLAQVTPKVRPV